MLCLVWESHDLLLVSIIFLDNHRVWIGISLQRLLYYGNVQKNILFNLKIFRNDSAVFQNSSDIVNSASVSSTGLLAYIISGGILILFGLIITIYFCLHREYFSYISKIIQVFCLYLLILYLKPKATFDFLGDNNLLILFSIILSFTLFIISMGSLGIALLNF